MQFLKQTQKITPKLKKNVKVPCFLPCVPNVNTGGNNDDDVPSSKYRLHIIPDNYQELQRRIVSRRKKRRDLIM